MKDYIKQAKTTESLNFDKIYERVELVNTLRLLHAGMGLATEAGEFVDMLKKHIFYGKPLDVLNLVEELGDSCWYIAIACDALQVSFEDVMKKNISKLKARYPNKFTQEDALNRDLKRERETLEEIK